MIRKQSIVLFVLFLLMIGNVYSQELRFDTYFNSGIGIVYSSSSDVDTFYKAFGADSEQNGYRFRLNGSVTSEARNAGLRFRLQSQSRLNQSGYFSMPFVYGWLRLFNDIVYVAGGLVDDSTWQTTDWWINDDVGEGLGVLVKVTPLTGLDFGFGLYLISQQAAGNNNILNHGGFLPNFANITPKVEDAKYVLSGSYTIPDIFYLGVSFRTKNKAGWNGTLDIDRWGYIYDGRQESSQLIGEFRFLAVKNLSAVAAVSLDKLENFDAEGNTIFSQTFVYRLDDIMLGFNAAEFFYNRRNPLGRKISHNPGFMFNLWGSYYTNNITPRLDLTYFYGGRSKLGGDETYMWHRRGFVNDEMHKIDSNDNRSRSVFSARPSVRFNLLNGIFLEIGNMFNYDFGNFNNAYGDSSDPQKDYLISNVFYIDLRWTF